MTVDPIAMHGSAGPRSGAVGAAESIVRSIRIAATSFINSAIAERRASFP